MCLSGLNSAVTDVSPARLFLLFPESGYGAPTINHARILVLGLQGKSLPLLSFCLAEEIGNWNKTKINHGVEAACAD